MPWAPSYASVDDLRDFVRIEDSADDTLMSTALDAASRAIDHAADPREGHVRQFGKTDAPEARYFTASPRGYDPAQAGQWITETDDIASPTGLTVATFTGAAWVEVTGCDVLPLNAASYGQPGTAIGFLRSSMPLPSLLADGVKVTATWGWPAVPPTIEYAALLQASRLLARREAPFGVAGSPETGTEIRLLAKLDPDVEQLVRPFAVKIGTVLA